jgi:hypothetical protein
MANQLTMLLTTHPSTSVSGLYPISNFFIIMWIAIEMRTTAPD